MPTPDQQQLSPQYAEVVELVRAAGLEAGRALLAAETQLGLVKEFQHAASKEDISGVTIDHDVVEAVEQQLAQSRGDAIILGLMLEGAASQNGRRFHEPSRRSIDVHAIGRESVVIPEQSVPAQVSRPKPPPRVRIPASTGRSVEPLTSSKLYPIGFDVGAERYINIISQENLRKAGPMARLLVGIGQGDTECFKESITADERLVFTRELINAGAEGHQVFDDEAVEDLITEALQAGYLKNTDHGLALTYEGLDEIYLVRYF